MKPVSTRADAGKRWLLAAIPLGVALGWLLWPKPADLVRANSQLLKSLSTGEDADLDLLTGTRILSPEKRREALKLASEWAGETKASKTYPAHRFPHSQGFYNLVEVKGVARELQWVIHDEQGRPRMELGRLLLAAAMLRRAQTAGPGRLSGVRPLLADLITQDLSRLQSLTTGSVTVSDQRFGSWEEAAEELRSRE